MLTGASGIGKSTTAKKVAQLANCQVIHNDKLCWQVYKAASVPKERCISDRKKWAQISSRFDCSGKFVELYEKQINRYDNSDIIFAEGFLYSWKDHREIVYTVLKRSSRKWQVVLLLYRPPPAIRIQRFIDRWTRKGRNLTPERARQTQDRHYREFERPTGESVQFHTIESEEEILKLINSLHKPRPNRQSPVL